MLDKHPTHHSAGNIVAVVGRSGAGKSTLIKLLAGLSLPGSGQIRVGERLLMPRRLVIIVSPERGWSLRMSHYLATMCRNICIFAARQQRRGGGDRGATGGTRAETVQHLPARFRTVMLRRGSVTPGPSVS